MQGVKNEWLSLGDEVYFYRRYYMSPDLLSSNSYVFRFPKCFLVIDPGGTEVHFNSIVALIKEENVDDLPVFIFLSHCHYDHVKALHVSPKEVYESFVIGGHVAAVEAMKEGDIDKTNSFLYTDKIPSVQLDFELFSESRNTPSLKYLAPEHDQQIITLIGDSQVIVYQTPGHSPCSVCYQIGNLLFVGDMFFAHYPAVIGIPGFSQPDLAKSLDFLKTIIREERITQVYSGHGLPLSADRAIKLIDRIIRQLPLLKGVVTLNREHFDLLKECTCAFMKDVDDHILSQNACQDANNRPLAEEVLVVVPDDLPMHDKLHAYLERFQKSVVAAESDPSQPPLNLPRHGLRIILSLQAIFKTLSVPSQYMLLYLEHLEPIFQTYMTLIGDLDSKVEPKLTDLSSIVGRYVNILSRNSWSGDELFNVAESKDELLVYLNQRIDELSAVAVSNVMVDSEPMSQVDPEHLNALLADVLESLVIDVDRKVSITPMSDEYMIGCKVVSEPAWQMSTSKVKFYDLFASLLDGKFVQYDDGSFGFLFPKSESFSKGSF